jgi:hypothetical protein
MKIIKVLFALVLLLGIAVLLLIGFAPRTYLIEESTVIEAPKDFVFDQTVRFQHFHEWSPWSAMDPEMIVSFEGEPLSLGAKYQWQGEKVGQGYQQITALTPDKVTLDLVFTAPYESKAETWYRFTDTPTQTTVTWGLSEELERPVNALLYVMGFEKNIRSDYKKGLASLKSRCESLAQRQIVNGYWIHETSRKAKTYLGKKSTVRFEALEALFQQSYPELFGLTHGLGLTPDSPPSALYFSWDETQGETVMAPVLAVEGMQEVPEPYETFTLQGPCLELLHIGTPEKSAEAHGAMDTFLKNHHLEALWVLEETLVGPPQVMDPNQWQTRIVYFIQENPKNPTPQP